MTSIRTTLAGAAVAALVLVLSGCSSDAEGDGATAEAPPPASAAPTTAAPGGDPSGREAAVETVFRSYYEALLARDFATACALNAPETNQALLQNLAAQGGQAATCEEALSQIYAAPEAAALADGVASTAEIQDVTVEGETATVTWSAQVGEQRRTVTNELRLIDGQWRLLDTAAR
jgi:hypothetical protein